MFIIKYLYLQGLPLQDSTLNRVSWNVILVLIFLAYRTQVFWLIVFLVLTFLKATHLVVLVFSRSLVIVKRSCRSLMLIQGYLFEPKHPAIYRQLTLIQYRLTVDSINSGLGTTNVIHHSPQWIAFLNELFIVSVGSSFLGVMSSFN